MEKLPKLNNIIDDIVINEEEFEKEFNDLKECLFILIDEYIENNIDLYKYLNQVDINLIFFPENINKKIINEWIQFLSDLNSKYGSNPWNRLNFMAQRLSKSHNSDKILTLCDDFMADITKGINNLLDRLPEITLENYITNTKNDINIMFKEYKYD